MSDNFKKLIHTYTHIHTYIHTNTNTCHYITYIDVKKYILLSTQDIKLVKNEISAINVPLGR